MDRPNSDGNTLLHFAAAANDAPRIRALAATGSNLDARNKKGETPLEVAQKKNKPLAVQALQQLLAEEANVGTLVNVPAGLLRTA